MFRHDIVTRARDRRPRLARCAPVVHAAALFSVAVALLLGSASCGAATPTRSLPPGASPATTVAGGIQTSTATATPAPIATPQPSTAAPVATRPSGPGPASPTAAPVAPSPFANPPRAPIAVQPAGARSGVQDVDLLIDAVLVNNLEARRRLIAYTITPCTTAQGMGGPPKCAPGEANGAPVEVFPFLGEEGEHIRPPAIDRILQFAVEGLYAVYRVPESAFRAEYWPAGAYAIIFLATGLQRQATVFVTNGKIVRLELSRQERWPGKDTRGIEWLLPPRE